MKKTLACIIALLTLALLLSAALSASGATLYEDVYVDAAANNTNGHYTSLLTALGNVAEGGTVHIVGTYTFPSDNAWPQRGRCVTVTGGTLDLSAWAGKDLVMGDHVTFSALTLSFATGKTSLFANGNTVTVSESVTFSRVDGTKVYIYGGGKDGTTVATTNLSLYAGIYEMAFGGSRNGTVSGDTHILAGGTVNVGAVDVNVHNSSNYIYGGGEGASNRVEGNTNITFTGNAMAMQVVGGSNKGYLGGSTHLNFAGGSSMGIYGGHYNADTGKDAYVNITGGQVQQVFGASSGANFTGNVYLRVLGGTVTRRIYGGCYNNLTTDGFTSSYAVSGHIYLTMDAAATVSFVKGDGYADHAIFARSRHKSLTENGVILFTSESAYSEFNGNLGYKQLYNLLEAFGSDVAREDVFGAGQLGSVSPSVKGAHTVTYTVNGATLTESCSGHGKGCGTAHTCVATLGPDPAASLVYTGQPIAGATLSFSNDTWMGEPFGGITYENNINAGTATAQVSHYKGTLTASFTIRNAPQDAPAGIANAANESIKGKADGRISGLTTALEWSADGVSYTPVTAAMTAADYTFAAGTYYFRTPAKTNYAPSAPVEITLGEGRMLTVTFQAEGSPDTVLETTWQGAVTAPAVPARVGYTQVAPYWNVTELTGLTADLTVHAVYTVNVYTVTYPTGAGYTVTGPQTVTHGETLALQVVLQAGYSRTEGFALTANGTPVAVDGAGSGSLDGVTEDLTLALAGVADITPPTATVTVGNGSWSTVPLLNATPFYYNAALNATVQASDTAGDLAKLEYATTGGYLDLNQIKALDESLWTPYTAPVVLGDRAHTAICIRATDAAGNVTYVATAMLIYDVTVPVIAGVADGTVYYENVTFTVTEENPVTVLFDGTPLTADNGVYTLPFINKTAALTVTDAAGNSVSCTVGCYEDTAGPAVTVTAGSGSWSSFPADNSFSFYYNTALSVSAQASDAVSGLAKLEYAKLGACMTLAQVKALPASLWSPYTAPIPLDGDQERNVIYFRAIDVVGNVAYYATAGMVYDATAPVIAGVEQGGSYSGTTTFTVTEKNLAAVTFDGTALTAEGGTYTLPLVNKSAALVVTDRAGNSVTYTVGSFAVYTVTFVADGVQVAQKTVTHGEAVTDIPAIPERQGYTVTAPVWDQALTNVTGDMTVTALYTADPVAPPAGDAAQDQTPPAGNDTPAEEGSAGKAPNAESAEQNAGTEEKGSALPIVLIAIGVLAVGGGVTAVFLIRKRRKA